MNKLLFRGHLSPTSLLWPHPQTSSIFLPTMGHGLPPRPFPSLWPPFFFSLLTLTLFTLDCEQGRCRATVVSQWGKRGVSHPCAWPCSSNINQTTSFFPRHCSHIHWIFSLCPCYCFNSHEAIFTWQGILYSICSVSHTKKEQFLFVSVL